MELLCPLCAQPMAQIQNTWQCPAGHSFDIARQGYVNLLAVQQKRSLHPGDTREQVLSRRAFLEGGFYAPIARQLCQMAQGLEGPILDVGCGEGYYSARLQEALDTPLVGLDISKEAVRCAAGRHKNALWLCASAARLPFPRESFGLITSLFALSMPEEFRRVLRPDGAFIQVLAAPDHLLGLKELIYPQLKNTPKNSTPDLPGFRLEQSRHLEFTFTVQDQQVQNLLSMTPHVYRIGKEGADRLRQTTCLTDRASCIFNLYRPE